MMKQSGSHLSLLLLSAVYFLLPDHPPADTPRAPKFLLPLSGLAVAAPLEAADLQDIKDIYAPMALPDPPPYLLLAALLLALLVIGGALVLLLRARRSARPRGPSPAELALAALHRAEQELPRRGSRHYTEDLAAILRRYLEQRFAVRTTRQTTAEFLRSLQEHLPAEAPAAETGPGEPSPLLRHAGELKSCLELCDLVKFAGLAPDHDRAVELGQTVRSFIQATAASPPTEP